ncbi:uncharacterized protein DUF4381 [Tamilnaduibacter salinus]|uniref:Uncharacterized protein DUF4381 n=1 Tax=Tamilnaduibacter salinus TaxID=1484056 RepID=A0A2U1D1M3_9GAMM|nr:DUF4381 domain-containing protein [Tamilnaduibacter salinus]PVY79295.1 uncharacterized protein DUF4381 [Tamilnaduibacter salinus]
MSTATDPLAGLRDIHMPEPGGFWPPAPGWWILAVIVVVALVALTWLVQRWIARGRWRRQARRELDALRACAEADNRWFAELNALLKRAARSRDPSLHPDALSGDDWVELLRQTVPQLSDVEVRALVQAAWHPAPDITPSRAAALADTWLRRA